MRILLARPRGFCAGVERAILCVERALERYGAPVYVLNDIVHNATVVNELADRGAVFVKRLSDVPRGKPVLFSAHGVGPEKWRLAEERNLTVIDATCPLVEKVHREAKRFADEDYTVVLIGEMGHDEVVGTRGWAPEHITVVFTDEEIDALQAPDPHKVAYVTQTTLSVEDSRRIIERLKTRFPEIIGPHSDDICYATQNRQSAVNVLAPDADLVLVVGDHASANSRRLAQICQERGIESHLVPSADHIADQWIDGVERVVITSGASVPEKLVQGVVEWFKARWDCEVEEVETCNEHVHFRLPNNIA